MSEHQQWVQAWGEDEEWWACYCSCGWWSKRLPFPNPDAALHAGALHKVVSG